MKKGRQKDKLIKIEMIKEKRRSVKEGTVGREENDKDRKKKTEEKEIF